MESEDVREGIRKFVEQTMGGKVSNREIKAIWVHPRSEHKRIDDDIKIEVGKYLDNRMSDTPNEKVMAIFESNTFLVCTPNRGVLRGMPYLYGKEEVYKVEEMDGTISLEGPMR